jgi:hypothetical protein
MLWLAGLLGNEVWTRHVEKAAKIVFGAEQEREEFQRLLISVMKVFNDTTRPGGTTDPARIGNGTQMPVEHQNRILSSTLAKRLSDDPSGAWRRANKSGPIDPVWLGNAFRNCLRPLGAQDYYQRLSGKKVAHHSVYYRVQFKKPWDEEFSPGSWERAQLGFFPSTTPKQAGDTGDTGDQVAPDWPADLNEQDLQWDSDASTHDGDLALVTHPEAVTHDVGLLSPDAAPQSPDAGTAATPAAEPGAPVSPVSPGFSGVPPERNEQPDFAVRPGAGTGSQVERVYDRYWTRSLW